MLLPIAGALIVATAVALALHAARERRTLAAEVRALRADLRRLMRTLETRRRGATPEPGGAEPPPGQGGPEHAGPADEDAVQSRGSRTVH